MSRERKYVHDVIGYNYRMTNMQAAIGVGQLERIDEILKIREEQAKKYYDLLKNSNALNLRPSMKWGKLTHWLQTITMNSVQERDAMIQHLKNVGIDSRQMVYPVSMAKPYLGQFNDLEKSVSAQVSMRSLHLPSGNKLTDEDLNRICSAVLDQIDSPKE
jgi:perosamine synthetase